MEQMLPRQSSPMCIFNCDNGSKNELKAHYMTYYTYTENTFSTHDDHIRYLSWISRTRGHTVPGEQTHNYISKSPQRKARDK